MAEAARAPSRPDAPPAPRRGLLDGPRCRYLCTARAGCRLLQLLACLLLAALSGVAYSSAGGYTGLFSLGSAHYQAYGGAYSGFSGADGERARRLDARFHELHRPAAQGALAAGGALLAWSSLALGLAFLRLPARCPAWLLAEALLDAAAAALTLPPGLYFYYAHLRAAYASAVCREREQLYRSKGHAGFDCHLHGAEVAVGLLAGLASATYAASAVLAVRAFRSLPQRPAKRGPFAPGSARRSSASAASS